MLDLLGFWFNVTVITILLCWWVLPVGALLGDHAICKITDDDHHNVLWNKLAKSLEFTGCSRKGWGDKWRIDETLWGSLGFILSITALFGGIGCSKYYKTLEPELQESFSILQALADVAVALAPYTSFIAAILLAYVGSIFIGKKVYKAMKLLNKLEKQATGE